MFSEMRTAFTKGPESGKWMGLGVLKEVRGQKPVLQEGSDQGVHGCLKLEGTVGPEVVEP